MKPSEIVLRRPLLTEKNIIHQEKQNHYAFEVARNANKIDIRRAVESKFNVSVEEVRTMVVKGKSKRMNTRGGITNGRRPSWKKAIVTLRAGEKIDFFEG